MAEAFLIGLATAAVTDILKKLLSAAISEIVFVWGYKDKLAALHGTLELTSGKLRDAERQKDTEAVMVWVKQLKDAVSEGDDVLDEIHYEFLRREVKKRKSMVRKVPSLPNLKRLTFRSNMGRKIDTVILKFSEINKRANELGLQNVQPLGPVVVSAPHNLFRETDPFLEEFKVVGREIDELHIIELLTQSRKEEKLTILPIVGMGGIGKTTLAKSIYNHPTIKQCFDVKAWLCVSVKVDADTLLAKIYESLAGEECKSHTRIDLIKDFRYKLGSKRYFLVLDDVWEEDGGYWDHFKSTMLKVNSQSGSAILITTRSLKIGTKAMSEYFHVLKSLPDDMCWTIFQERAFVVGRSLFPEVEEIGRKIVKKCRGLPLLVSVIGGMLRNCYKKEKWLSIKDSKVWDLEEEGDRIQKILKLSFDNLPSSTVKQCFLYCSIFKKDTILKREDLVRIWMALGLVHADERRNKEAEDVGNDIFQILVSSSLFQDVKMDQYGYVTGCMHDLSLSLCKHESLCLVDPTRDDIARIPNVKHLSIWSNDKAFKPTLDLKYVISVVFKNDMTSRTLHTFILHNVTGVNTISMKSFKNLRILKFQGDGLKKINNSIGELVHLTYLDLSFTVAEVFPESIVKLYHLQTLNLTGSSIPWLPRDMSDLISMRHLIYREGYLIGNVRQMTSLRTLSYFSVGRDKIYQIAELGPLKHLAGEICITNLDNVRSKEDALKADLSGKMNLTQINFQWRWTLKKDTNHNEKDVLEGLQPPGNLKSLAIENFAGDHFLTWVMKMSINTDGRWTPLHNIIKIKLYRCKSCLYLPMLECLPLLEDLVLEGMDSLTCLSSNSMQPLSPSLRSLQLNDMISLENWIDASTPNSSTMLSPVLKSLLILDCPEITNLDECHPHPLVSLTIRNCKMLVSIKSIQGLTSLQYLKIDDCRRLLEIPYLKNYEHHHLKTLEISGYMTSIPCEIFDCFSFLSTLKLGRFPEELHSFPSLKGIEKLRNHLQSLTLCGWEHWESIPEEIKHLTSLTRLTIRTFGIRELPLWLINMSHVQVKIVQNAIPISTQPLHQRS